MTVVGHAPEDPYEGVHGLPICEGLLAVFNADSHEVGTPTEVIEMREANILAKS
jgi:hypothetical protein